MPDLLLELFSEEIPARMQARAAEDLRKAVTDRLVEAGLAYEGAKAFVTPRRLALSVHGVPARQADLREEKKGPRVGAPENAIAGFLRAAGLRSINDAKVQPDKKGDFYIAVIEKPGRPALDVIAEFLPEVIKKFPWSKSMRWGEQSKQPGALGWVRPLHSIVATFGPETEDPDVVPFKIDGIAAGNETHGHRFMAPAPFPVRRLADYMHRLEQAKVVLDAERRRDIILTEAKQLAFAQGLELVEDEGLLNEVAGLVEWPVVLMGSFDERFLQIPEEVIRATIRNNQKCFVLRESVPSPLVGEGREGGDEVTHGVKNSTVSSTPRVTVRPPPPSSPHKGEGRLVNKFLLVANIEAEDGGAAIIAGNERVIRARLADAKFFYDTDLKTKLEDRLPKFKDIIFHEKLGTQAERIERIQRLAAELAPLVGADVEKARRAARLAKADLLTEMVGEFPELQGTMGKYYAQAQGEDEAVAHAIEDHYRPKGPDDLVPSDPVSVAVALADKIDTLIGFLAIGAKPKGSGDPYALRRSALGVIRIIGSSLRLRLESIITNEIRQDIRFEVTVTPAANALEVSAWFLGERVRSEHKAIDRPITEEKKAQRLEDFKQRFWNDFPSDILRETIRNLLLFFAERLKVQLRDQGARHDLVDAVFALSTSPWRGEPGGGERAAGARRSAAHPTPPLRGDPPPPGEGEGVAPSAIQDDLLLIVRRVEALGKFLDTDDGRNLLAGYKRATNIIRIEEKKDKREYTGAPDFKLYQQDEEKALAKTIAEAKSEAARAVAAEDFEAAMRAMAKLRPYVDAFFDKVTVNVDEPELRENRLKLLNEIRAATRAVADFSKIEG